MQRILTGALVLGLAAITGFAGTAPAPHAVTAETYEHLATAIIEIRATEESLVKGLLHHHYHMAVRHLESSAQSEGSERRSHVEAAAAEITNIANEGDKPVQAIRQRLLKAGHHHHTDAETEEDYMFVDSSEKKELLALAGEIARGGVDPEKAANRLGSLFQEVIRAE